MAEIGRKGGSAYGSRKIRGDSEYYSRIGKMAHGERFAKTVIPKGNVPKYSISILAHQNLALTRKCVQSVMAYSKDYQLYLTDNGCTDGTEWYFDELAREHSNVTVFHHPKNLGFIEPNRLAFRLSTSPYHVLLNNDTVVMAGWLERLQVPFGQDPKAAMVGILGCCSQLRPNFTGEAGPRFEYVEFSCVMMNRAIIASIEPSLFPPELVGAYGEDSYLSLRARECGYNLHRIQMTLVHYRGATSAIVPQAKGWEHANHQFLLKRFKRYMMNRRFDFPTIVRRRAAYGDVLLTTAVIRALKKAQPVSPILVETQLPQLFMGNPDVQHAASQIPPTVDALLIDLNNASEMNPSLNIIDAYAKVAGLGAVERKSHFNAPQGDREWAQRTTQGEPVIVIHPGPSWRDKTWDPAKWAALLRQLPMKAILVGNEIKWPLLAALDLRGRTNLGQLGAIIGEARLFVGIDSLPIHLAQALRIPVVGLFGSTKPELILNEGSPWKAVCSNPNHPGTGLRHAAPGKTYVECPAGNPMDTITVEAVLAAVMEALQ